MESTDSSTASQQPQLPPGFRFHPTDEELVVFYLKQKAANAPIPVSIIAEVDIYKFDPWELPAKATFGEQEWYFFSPRDRKYPNGARPNRAATSGYWKATGTDKPVLTSGGTQKVGVKKALVFYGGKPPKGIKTNWIMHEYRLADNKSNSKPPGCDIGSKKGSLRLDDWVLCRIYKKNSTPPRAMDHDQRDDMSDHPMMPSIPPSMSPLSSVGTPHKLHEIKTSNYGNFLDYNETNMFDGIMNHDGSISHDLTSSMSRQQLSLNGFPATKRTLPALFPNEEGNASPSTKRFLGDNGERSIGESGEDTSSIASLLSQLPQTTSLHQQAMLGSLADVRQPPLQLAGLNWYS